MYDMDEGKRPDRLDLLLTDYFRPESAAAELLPRRIAAAARESGAALERLDEAIAWLESLGAPVVRGERVAPPRPAPVLELLPEAAQAALDGQPGALHTHCLPPSRRWSSCRPMSPSPAAPIAASASSSCRRLAATCWRSRRVSKRAAVSV